MDHEILGEGTYGCVIKPYLKCKSKKNRIDLRQGFEYQWTKHWMKNWWYDVKFLGR